MTEDEMVAWHYRLEEHEFEQAPGDGDGQGSLACCSSWGRKESDMTEQQNWTELNTQQHFDTPWVSLLFTVVKPRRMYGDTAQFK